MRGSFLDLTSSRFSLGLDFQDALRLRSWWVARFRVDEAEFQGIGGRHADLRGLRRQSR